MNPSSDLAGHFRDLLSVDAVVTGGAVRSFAVDGHAPHCVLFPATVDEVSRCTAAADLAELALIPTGNATRLGIGRAPRKYDVAISTQRLRRIVAHEAADMTVTVEAGLTLAALNVALASAGQRLPLDPPLPEQTTVGALIGMDACGPLRLSHGKVRDLLIGVTAVLADGTVVKGGGRVVKNVAGYDLMKLFTGSFGSLGIIVEATFKVRPCPQQEVVFVISAAGIEAATALALDLLAAPLAPLYVEALNGAAAARVGLEGAAVMIGCGSSVEEIAAQRERLAALPGATAMRALAEAEGEQLHTALQNFPVTGRDASLAGKLTIRPSKLAALLARIEVEAEGRGIEAALLAHAGNGVAYLRCGTADDAALTGFAQWLRPCVREAGGWVVFEAVPSHLKERIDPWDADVPGFALMRGIKQTLDPNGRLSPGRFVGGI